MIGLVETVHNYKFSHHEVISEVTGVSFFVCEPTPDVLQIDRLRKMEQHLYNAATSVSHHL